MSHTKRFLIIDDNARLGNVLKAIVESHGGQCDVAASVEGAIDAMKKHAYTVIISDSTLDRRLENDGKMLLQDLSKLSANPEETSYLKSILAANANATKVLYTGDGGSYARGDGSGYRDEEFGQARYRREGRGDSHFSGIDRIETKPGSPTKLIFELMGGPSVHSAGCGQSR